MASDILFLSETHTSYADTLTCEGYKWVFLIVGQIVWVRKEGDLQFSLRELF